MLISPRNSHFLYLFQILYRNQEFWATTAIIFFLFLIEFSGLDGRKPDLWNASNWFISFYW